MVFIYVQVYLLGSHCALLDPGTPQMLWNGMKPSVVLHLCNNTTCKCLWQEPCIFPMRTKHILCHCMCCFSLYFARLFWTLSQKNWHFCVQISCWVICRPKRNKTSLLQGKQAKWWLYSISHNRALAERFDQYVNWKVSERSKELWELYQLVADYTWWHHIIVTIL